MSRIGSYVKFTTHAGQRDALVAVLMEAAASLQAMADCQVYIINVAAVEPDVVWVTEVWSSAEAHEASLTSASAREAIQRGMALIAEVVSVEVLPLGGKGLP